MPYGKQRLVSVVPYTGSTLKYGFRTNVDAAVSTALGHAAVTITDGSYPTGFCLGANYPKPARASRKRTTGYQSSWCDAGSRAAARTAGWTVGPARVKRANDTTRTKCVYITFEGNKFGWRMPIALHTKISADLADLGILEATAGDKDIAFGVSIPRFPKVSKANDTNGEVYTTFCDPEALDLAAAGGWSTVRSDEDIE